MAHASVSWACGRHPSTFDQYIEYGPVAVVANDGDANNGSQSATDNDVEIGDDRLRLEHLCTRLDIDALLHFCSLRQFLPLVRKTHSTLCHSPPHYTSASFFLFSHASGDRVEFAFASPADVFREPHLVTGNMQTERMLHLDSSMQRPSSRTAATRGCNSSGNGWLRQSVAAARDGCVIGILLGLQQRVAATQAFST